MIKIVTLLELEMLVFFITPHLHFDYTLYFDITLMPNGVIVLWPAFI